MTYQKTQVMLLVAAATRQEYMHWLKASAKELNFEGFCAKHVPCQTLGYIGHRDCFFTEVGAGHFLPATHRYFETHNIKPYEEKRQG